MGNNSKSQDPIPVHVQERIKTILPGFTAYGFNLNGMSANPNVVTADRNAIVLKYSEEIYYLFATYDFDPLDKSSSPKVASAFDSIKNVIIRHSLVNDNSQKPFHRIPGWLKMFKNIDCLILDNVRLGDDTIFEYLHLKLLAFKNTKVKDMTSLIKGLGNMKDLEFLMHQTLFSDSEIAQLKISLPQLFVLNIASDQSPTLK